MLTRLEVDGFKNLLGVTVDFGPYTCVVGPNGVGKSNLFDALRFLSLLADRPIMQAAAEVRGAAGRRADPRGLFWSEGDMRGNSMRFAVEMIVPHTVTDDFGRTAEATTTFLRYELELAYVEPEESGGFGRIELRTETLTHLRKSEAGKRIRFPHSVRDFRDKVVQGHRAGAAYISTDLEGSASVVQVHQDGGSRGQPKEAARRAQSTVVGSTSDAGYPTILAARREFQSWRTLALEPSALRAPDELDNVDARSSLGEDGSHLPVQLYSLAHPRPGDEVNKEDRAKWSADTEIRTYARVASRLAQLIGVHGVRVDRDDRRGLLTLQVQESRSGTFRDARQVSDGTLRFLALAVLEQDARVGGLICTEEPENGIHPERLKAMLDLIHGLAVDPEFVPGPENPLRQVIVNTHSLPYMLLHERRDELLFAEPVVIRRADVVTRSVEFRPIAGTWRCAHGPSPVTMDYVANHLRVGVGEQVPLLGRGAA